MPQEQNYIEVWAAWANQKLVILKKNWATRMFILGPNFPNNTPKF